MHWSEFWGALQLHHGQPEAKTAGAGLPPAAGPRQRPWRGHGGVPEAAEAAHPRADDDPPGQGEYPRPLEGRAAYLAEHPEVVTEKLPSYAPETNPDESVWGHTKHGRLSNFTPEETAEFRAVMVEEFERIHRRPDLLAAFIRHAKVPIRLRC